MKPSYNAALVLARRGVQPFADHPGLQREHRAWLQASRWVSYSGAAPEDYAGVPNDELLPAALEALRHLECPLGAPCWAGERAYPGMTCAAHAYHIES